jgi:epoxyqueuosine reductase
MATSSRSAPTTADLSSRSADDQALPDTAVAQNPARPDLAQPDLAFFAGLDDAAFPAHVSDTPIKRSGRNRLARHVAIAIGNSGDATLAPTAARLAAADDPVVAGGGAWALARLEGQR